MIALEDRHRTVQWLEGKRSIFHSLPIPSVIC